MSGTFGGIACNFLRGTQASPKTRLDVWQRPGIDGYGAIDLGKGDSKTEFILVAFGLYAATIGWGISIEDKQGAVVTVVNDWAESMANFLVEKVGLPQVQYFKSSLGDARAEIRVSGVFLP